MKKLSMPQMKLLRQMAKHSKGESEVPWGTRESGRLASAWYRTSLVLVHAGLAEWPYSTYWSRDLPEGQRTPNPSTTRITQAGRDFLAVLDSVVAPV